MRKHNKWGFVQRLKSLRIEDIRKVDSQYIRHEEGALLTQPNSRKVGPVFKHPVEREVGKS